MNEQGQRMEQGREEQGQRKRQGICIGGMGSQAGCRKMDHFTMKIILKK